MLKFTNKIRFNCLPLSLVNAFPLSQGNLAGLATLYRNLVVYDHLVYHRVVRLHDYVFLGEINFLVVSLVVGEVC